jgi:hypothetical protein
MKIYDKHIVVDEESFNRCVDYLKKDMEINNSIEDIQSIRAKAFSYRENAFNRSAKKDYQMEQSNQLALF